ncbi:MAG: hypothetical protein R3B96_23880 [Pirellulaceae bacterium]
MLEFTRDGGSAKNFDRCPELFTLSGLSILTATTRSIEAWRAA